MITQLTKKFIYRLQKKPVILTHEISSTTRREVKLWDYENPNGWMDNQDYVLFSQNEELSLYEILEKQIIAAEYGVCREISLVGGNILDVGCGVGRHIFQIASAQQGNVKKIIGIDISPNLLKNAQSRNKKYYDNVELHLASADSIPFVKKDSINFVIVMYRTYGNLSDDVKERHLKEIKRVLKKDGYFILSLGNRKFMEIVARQYRRLGGPTKYLNKKTGDIVYGSGVRQHYFEKNELVKYFSSRQFSIKRLYEAGTNFIVWLNITS